MHHLPPLLLLTTGPLQLCVFLARSRTERARESTAYLVLDLRYATTQDAGRGSMFHHLPCRAHAMLPLFCSCVE